MTLALESCFFLPWNRHGSRSRGAHWSKSDMSYASTVEDINNSSTGTRGQSASGWRDRSWN